MGHPQDPHRSFISFGNPFRMKSPKGSDISPKLLPLLNAFEERLEGRIRKLMPAAVADLLSLPWMISAMELLCEIHTDIKRFITSLELPVTDWESKWIDVYFDNSVKVLDICIAFSSEISQIKQGHLFLQLVMHNLDSASANQFVKARSSLDGWKQHIASKNPRLDNCFSAMDGLAQSLDQPKIKKMAKGKLLMQAMYGVRAVTLLVCGIFAATFTGSTKKLMELQVPETCLWAEAFTDIQTFVNTEIRRTYARRVMVLKELEAVDAGVEKLYPILRDMAEPVEAEVVQNSKAILRVSSEQLALRLDLLAKEVDRFFQIVLTGRNALLGNINFNGNLSNQMQTNKKVDGKIVRQTISI